MPDTTEIPRPARLWKSLPPDRRIAAAEAFWADEQAGAEQAEAAVLIARQLKFRPKSVVALNDEKKARYLVGLAGVSDAIAARLLVSHHLASERPMMGRFLDLLGVAHEDGLIQEEELKPPEPAKLDAAAKGLAAEFPVLDVARYFNTLLWQDPETWAGLRGRPESMLPQ